MIYPAQLYRDQLQQKLISTWYDPRYKYYYDSSGKNEQTIPDNCYYQRHFASVDKYGNVIGYICYTYDDYSSYAKWFGIMCFEGSCCFEFIADVIRVVDDIFEKFNLNRIEFDCFSDNPALESYRRFIRKYGGEEVARFRKTVKLQDGTWQDSIKFEILYDEDIISENNITRLHKDRLRLDKMFKVGDSK